MFVFATEQQRVSFLFSRRFMKITRTFLEPLDRAESPQPYAHAAVRYIPNVDGEVAAFEKSGKGKEVKAQYRAGIKKLKDFLISNGSLRNEAAARTLDKFSARVEAGSKGYFSKKVGTLYDHGKGALDSLCVDVEDSRIPLAERQSVVRDLADDLDRCTQGALSSLITAADSLRLSVHGLRGHAKTVWEGLFVQVISEFCRRVHVDDRAYENNEIHYVNAYRNYFAHDLGLTVHPDEIVNRNGSCLYVETAIPLVNEALTADVLVKHLAESCLSEVRKHFKEYLDRPLTEAEAFDFYQKYESIDAALRSRYGEIECRFLISPHEGRGTEGAPYTVIDKRDLLVRAIARNLRKAGMLEKEKFKTEACNAAGHDRPIRQLKRITDDVYYVKEQMPSQSHASYRSVQLTDLARFTMPQERARTLFKSVLTSTTDMDQLSRLNPSPVWDLITQPEGGLPENARQWLGAMAHVAVKRYREANPDGNEFLLRKAQEEIAKQSRLAKQNDLFTLMDMGEESLALRVISSLSDSYRRKSQGFLSRLRGSKSSKEPAFNLCKGAYRDTLLHLAAQKGCHDVLKRLADEMDVDVRNRIGETPLMVAAKLDSEACLETLLMKGANANLEDSSGQNALLIAARSGQARNVEVLARLARDVSHAGCDTALMAAVEEGHVEVVRSLLNFTNQRRKNLDGHNAFHLAALYGRVNLLEELKGRFPDENFVNERTNHQETPLMLAARSGRADAVRWLLANNADPNLLNQAGSKASDLASASGHPEIADILWYESSAVGRFFSFLQYVGG